MNGRQILIEAWMAQKLGLPMNWDEGVTTRQIRRDRIRVAILEVGLADTIAGRRPGQAPETWAQLFERIFEQPLQQTESNT